MSDGGLTNAAVEFMHAGYTYLSSVGAMTLDRDRVRATLADDFVFEDRRTRAGGVNFGRVEASGWIAFLEAIWDVSSDRVRMSLRDVVAVRGQRLAAYVEVLSYGGIETHESIQIACLDPELRKLQLLVLYDADDTSVAIAELDRLHAEIDD